MDTDAFLGFVIIAVLAAITVVPFIRIFRRPAVPDGGLP
jgi:hypothetical protein